MQDNHLPGHENAATEEENTQSIIQILDQQSLGWNTGDAGIYAGSFAEQGCFTNLFGMFFVGHAAFLQKHEAILKGPFKDSVFEYKLVHLQFPTADVAVVETLITVTGLHKAGLFNNIYTDQQDRLFTRLSQVIKKEKNQWKIVAYHNVDIKEGVVT